eukprot:SAG22_NODE_11951_length_462_cov_0.991736_1_plen_50_part_10
MAHDTRARAYDRRESRDADSPPPWALPRTAAACRSSAVGRLKGTRMKTKK